MGRVHITVVNVLNRIKRWHQAPAKLNLDMIFEGVEGVENVENVDYLPPPEITWLLLGFMHYRERQMWARQVCVEKIKSLGPEECDHFESGVVPGLPKWIYCLGFMDSFLLNQLTGEEIHFDIERDQNIIMSKPYLEYVRQRPSLRNPNDPNDDNGHDDDNDPSDPGESGVAEQRLRELYPTENSLLVGWLWLDEILHVFRKSKWWLLVGLVCELHGELRKYKTAVEAFLKAWAEAEDLLLLAGVIGDWITVQRAAETNNQPAIVARVKPLIAKSRNDWLACLNVSVKDALDDDGLLARTVAEGESLYMMNCEYAFTDAMAS